jgi:hypothetical protein
MSRGMRKFVHNFGQVERSFLDEKIISENERPSLKRH